jgi:hypothetical protein
MSRLRDAGESMVPGLFAVAAMLALAFGEHDTAIVASLLSIASAIDLKR